jgi:hypothetical protein
MDIVRIRVLRPFYYNRIVAERGKELDVPKSFAIDMVANNKAEYAPKSAETVKATEPEKVDLKVNSKIKKEEK